MRRGSILIGVFLTMCIVILLFGVFSSSMLRTNNLSNNRTVAGQAYYKTEARIYQLNLKEKSKQKIKKLLAKNMELYTASFKKTELPTQNEFSKDWSFKIYPDPDTAVRKNLLDITYHNRTEGVHCDITGSFAFENTSFCSETGVLDPEHLPEGYNNMKSFIGESTNDWVSFCQDIYPEKKVKNVCACSVIRLYQKLDSGYELRSYVGSSGEHLSFVEEFDRRTSINTIGPDSEFTQEETKTDLYLEKPINGFPSKDRIKLFGIYALDGDLYVNTDSTLYGILILKGGNIFLGENVNFSIYGLVISETPVSQTEECKFFYKQKYMLREAVVLPNFLDLQLIGIRE